MRINNIKILDVLMYVNEIKRKKNKNKKFGWLVSQVQIRSTTI